jgi:hypothetical protein
VPSSSCIVGFVRSRAFFSVISCWSSFLAIIFFRTPLHALKTGSSLSTACCGFNLPCSAYNRTPLVMGIVPESLAFSFGLKCYRHFEQKFSSLPRISLTSSSNLLVPVHYQEENSCPFVTLFLVRFVMSPGNEVLEIVLSLCHFR